MKKLYVFSSLLIICSFVLSACGSAKYSTKLKVTLAEFSYTPKEFSIPAGKDITLAITNTGAIEHEFVIMKKGTAVTPPFDADDEPNVFWEVEVTPGKSESVTFTSPPDAGEYQVVCGTPGHFEAGMTGKLMVLAP